MTEARDELVDVGRLRRIWKGMKARCQTPTNTSFPAYGGRGISVCAEWQAFEAFVGWAITHGYADDLEIDRIDADGPYARDNCRWVKPEINAARTHLDRAGAYLADLHGKLTEESIERAVAARFVGKLWDGAGLHLRFTANGTRSWRYRFQFERRDQLLTLGRHPDLTIAEARELHAVARAKRAAGRNPSAIRAETARRRRRAQRASPQL